MQSEIKIRQYLEWCTTDLPCTESRESPVFFLQGNEWIFLSVLKFSPDYNKWYCAVYLELKKKHKDVEPCHVKCQIGFRKEETLSLHKKEFEISHHYQILSIWLEDLQRKIPADYMDGNPMKFVLFPDDVTSPLLNLSEKSGDKSVQTPPYIDTHLHLEGVSKNYSTLFDECPNHDVEFVCGDETIKAHRNVICCRSAVFTSMLSSDMTEGKTGRVKITDLEGSIFRKFLRCLYTGVLPGLTIDIALRFYEAADKYAVNALKKQCANFLAENLSVENACEVLIISDRHNDPDLKNSVMEYIMKEEIPQRMGEKWPDFCKENQTLSIEVLNLLYQNLVAKRNISEEE